MHWIKLIFLALSLGAFAASPCHSMALTASDTQVNLIKELQYLEDPSGQLTLEDVEKMASQFKKWDKGGDSINFGLTPSAYWIRIPLKKEATAPSDWLMEVNFPRISTLDFYQPNYLPIYTGSDRSFESRPIFDRNFIFPLNVNVENEYFYLRMKSNYALTLPLKIWKPNAYRHHQQIFSLMQFAYYGILLLLAGLGGVIYYSISDKRFFIYSAYIVAVGLGMFASNGYGRQFLWPEISVFDDVSGSFFLSISAFLMIEFAEVLILRYETKKWINNFLILSKYAFAGISFLLILNLIFKINLILINKLLMLNSLAFGVLMTVACLQAFKRKQKGVRFFLMGWMILCLGIITASLRILEWIPSNGLTSYSLQLANVAEVIMMALALGELLRIEHGAHIALQQEALDANKSLLEMTQNSEKKLAQAVDQRTRELDVALSFEKELREQYVRFGSMISHEFRTPLSIIQTQTSLLSKEHSSGVDHVNKRLESIASASKRLLLMFEKWLSSDAMRQSSDALEPEMLDLQSWIHTLIGQNEHLFKSNKIEFELESCAVMVDEYQLGVALINLIDNAVKYSPEKSIIRIAIRQKVGYVGVEVKDEGSGILLNMQEKIFSEYFRIFPEKNIRGVGLGLSIVRRIAHAHGGHVDVTSAPGQGSIFCIWLSVDKFKNWRA